MPSAKRERQREGRQAGVAAAIAEHKRRQRWRSVRNIAIAFVVIVGVIFFLSRRSGDNDKSTVAGASASASTGASETTATSGTTLPPKPFQFGTGVCPNADGSSPKTID